MKKRTIIDGVPYCDKGHALVGNNLRKSLAHGKEYQRCRQCQYEWHQARQRLNNALPPETETIMNNYKEPLRSVENGYGYHGTVSYDKTMVYTQCHLCGHLFEHVGIHIGRFHNVTVKEYKKQFGIPVRMSLRAPNNQWAFRKWNEMTPELKEKRLKALKEGKKKMLESDKPRTWQKSLHQKNLEGRCPDQLLEKIAKLASELGQPPMHREFCARYGSGYGGSVIRTFGTWNNALKMLDMTVSVSGPRPIHTPESLIFALRLFRDKYKREAMTVDTMQGNVLPAINTFRRHFGTWSKAKEAAYDQPTT